MTNIRLRVHLPAIVALGVALAFALVAFIAGGDITVQIVCSSLAVAFVGLACALAMAQGQSLVASLAAGQLGTWFGASAAVVYGLASLIWVAPPEPFGSLISRRSVLVAMGVAAAATSCFAAGYLLAPRRSTQPSGRWIQKWIVTERPVRSGQRTAWLLFGIAVCAYLGQVAIGRFGYLSSPALAVSSGNPFAQLLFVIGNFGVFAVALSSNDYARRSGRKALLSFVLLLAAQSVSGVFSASKEVIALGIVAALFGYVASGRRIPLIWLTAAVSIFVFVVVPFTTSFRNQVAVGNSRLSPAGVIEAVSKQGLTFFIPTQGQSPAIQTIERVSRIGDVAIIVQRTTPSDIAYRPLTELVAAPLLGLVPRLVWPGKPILATGYEFSRDYYGLSPTQYTASAVTPEGDLWRHGGWLVLIVGMVLFGVGVRILDVANADVRGAPLRLLGVLTFFPLIVMHEIDAVLLLASIPSLLVGVALAARVVTARERIHTAEGVHSVPRVVLAVNQPIQHFAASFRRAAESPRLEISVVYWVDNSDGAFDHEFDRHVSWDVDLLSGYPWRRARGRNPFARAWRFTEALRAPDPDIVVCFGWASAAARLTIPWCVLTGTPLLFYGDTSWQSQSGGLRRWLRTPLLRAAFWLAEGAISSGAFNREFYIHQGMHPKRIIDSVYPIDLDSYAEARKHRSTRKQKIVIGFAGKLIARKGVDELLVALQLISDDDSWHARIIGDGEAREQLVKLAKALSIGSRVDFVGFRNTSEMPSELADCDIVVVPSYQDNRGMIAAEAMAAGAVVVVSSNTGVWGRGDLVEDGGTGRVYKSGDPGELAAIIEELLQSSATMTSLRRRGARRAAEHGPDAFTRALERAAVTVLGHE